MDLKTFTALGCYGTSVITALTAQNTLGVHGVHACPPEFVQAQLRAVLDDIPIVAIKTGMLYDAATTRIVVQSLKRYQHCPLVVDPVMVSTSGHTLLESTAIETLRAELLPLATIVTPNIPEAELLLNIGHEDVKIVTIEDMITSASHICSSFGVQCTLLKGGHLLFTMDDIRNIETSSLISVEYTGTCDPNFPLILRDNAFEGKLVVDVLYESSTQHSTLFVRPRIDSRNTHGTGCTLGAALTCGLAKGSSSGSNISSSINLMLSRSFSE